MEGNKIDGNTFYKRIEKIYKVWKHESKFANTLDCFAIIRGKHSEDLPESIQTKTSLFHEFLLGYEFTETIFLFTEKKVLVFLAPKKIAMIESAVKPSSYRGPAIELVMRDVKNPNDKAMEDIFKYIQQSNPEANAARCGTFGNEPGIGSVVDEWGKFFNKYQQNIELLNCTQLLEEILATKDSEELERIKISSKYATYILQNLNKKFETIIDEDNKVSHQTISNEIRVIAEKQKFKEKTVEKFKLANVNLGELDVGNNPVIQSGGVYNMDLSSQNDSSNLSSDVIICKVSTRYRGYNSNVVRTFMIDTDKSQQNTYKILCESFNYLLSQLAEGVKISTVYEKTLEFLTSKDSNLKNHISDTFGHGIGCEFSNQSLSINASNERKLQAGTCFNIVMSLTGLKNEKGFKYSFQIADTVALKSSNQRENYTNEVSKSLSDIYYNMENDEEEGKNGKESDNKMVVDSNSNLHQGRRTRRQNNANEDKAREAQNRKEHQLELLAKKNQDFKDRMERNSNLNEEIQISKKMLNSVKSYNNRAQIPHDVKPGKIYVDVKNDTVILPIFKMMVPFHISLIKNVSKSEENSYSFLRINFHTPISGTNNLAFGDLNMNQPVFIKDLSYKSKDHKTTANLSKTIKDMIQRLKRKDQEDLVKSDLVTQENLILMKGRKIGLSDMTIRPNITNKKTTGYLEAHTNGFRFVASKGDTIDIIYKNIKHAFFQPCENELIVLIHFHLHNPIVVGRKKTQDVQFYREAGSQADDLHQGRRGNDYEEYESELKERHARERINDEFLRFTQQVQEQGMIEFDIPYRDLAFSGVPYKSSVTLLPTVNCLVSLIELPFFVITLDELELIYFERVSHSLKNFDMAFVFKDLNKPVHRITAIPMENLEMIKSWLDECDILFSEGLYNINWVNIILKIKKDPEGFIETGGWGFLHDAVDDDEYEDGVDEEEEGDPSFNEESDYSGDDDSEISEESEYSDSDVEGGDSELSEEGLSWDELEKHAAKQDKEQLKRLGEEEVITKAPQTRKRGKK